MKKLVIVVSALFALAVAERAVAEDQHKGHMHSHDSAQAPAHKCPHHPEVTSATPAKCPKCGMDLTIMNKHGVKYRCPMHKDIVSDKPGTCEKCKMKLETVENKDPSKNK